MGEAEHETERRRFEGESVDTIDDPAFHATVLATGEVPSVRRALPRALAERYEEVELIGEGGMGVVYRARDPRLGREVALKLIKGDDPGLIRRFIQEARAQARVQHENVCRVYEAGHVDGEPYIVMQLIDGAPLSRVAPELSLLERVALMRSVCAAVHEAHRLGLVHRDLKPQNILVARGEDGAPVPYVVDFGLAREVEGGGQTVTGAVLGTPAYMPPEQAVGDASRVDRRSDVYALGATLYDLLAGRPPFADESPWRLLMKVAYEDAPALSRVKRGLPADLETIVMKCLERDPARRYDSARALGDDLGRFLDAEPIAARRASLGYVAWKKIRKNRLAVALVGTAVMAAIALLGVWIKGKRDAAEEARLAQALGEDVKGMELFLRNAYGMPLHDVERERAVIRKRLDRIADTMHKAGRVGQGPGHYAMGRGLLALGDPAAARAELDRARAAGYASAALDASLGQALGELYRREVEGLRRLSNEEERKRKTAEISAALRDPALAHLRAAKGAEVESPAYVEGLIALHEGKNEEALQKARAAFEQQPWLYEAKRLEGDARYAMGSPFRHDGAFDWDRMMEHFGPAAEAYRAAAEMARSDPAIHRAECELWEKIGWAEDARRAPNPKGFDTAGAACDRAVRASTADVRAKVQRSLVLSARAYQLKMTSPEAGLSVAEEAVRAAEEALRDAGADVDAHYALARALFERADRQVELRREVAIEPALAAYRRVIELDPRFTWAVSELGDALISAAAVERLRGGDPRRSFADAAAQFDRAALLDPTFTLAARKKVQALSYLVEAEVTFGGATDPMIDELLGAVGALEQRVGTGEWATAFWRARAHRQRARREASLGRDPRPALSAARAALDPFARPRDNPGVLMELAEGAILEAQHLVRWHEDPSAALAAARAELRDAVAAMGAVAVEWALLEARVELIAARLPGRAVDFDRFAEAQRSLQPPLAQALVDPEPLALAVEIHARRAVSLVGAKRDPGDDLTSAEARLRDLRARSPRTPSVHVAAGLVALAEARCASDAAVRRSAASRGRSELESALRASPPLTVEYAADLEDLRRLSE